MEDFFMKKLLVFVSFLIVNLVYSDEFTSFISSLNIEAKTDINLYKTNISVDFDISINTIDMVIKQTDSPGDAYVIIKISEATDKPIDVVLASYKKNKGKGWGAISQEMGIKPGSDQFQELKKKGSKKNKNKNHSKNDDNISGKKK